MNAYPADVRMRGFARRTTVDDAWAWIQGVAKWLGEELVALDQAAGRVLAKDLASPVDVPGFDRAMMDGFAVRARDVASASTYNPLPLQIIGQALPGQPFDGTISAGQAIRIMTGAPLPEGADAVLPAEQAQLVGQQVVALADVPAAKHVGRAGEDVRQGSQLFAAGRRLRPQDVGLLSSVGIGNLPVVRQPRVQLVITGSELLPPGTRPQGHFVTDANGPMLAALVRRDGGKLLVTQQVGDDPDKLRAAMRDECDVLMISGGSSVGQEDHAPSVLAELGELAIHGIAMRPSSPAGMGTIGQTLVVLLPGNPVSCLCAYDFFAGRMVRCMGGRPADWPYRCHRVRLARKLVSALGRVDYARVSLEKGMAVPLSTSGASILSSTTIADGFVVVPEKSEGYPAGTEVDMFLYD